jgi:hypothetical protein
MKYSINQIGLISFFFAILFISCDDTNTVEDIDKRVIPSSNVSYSEHLQIVFDYKCNNSYCHNSVDRAGGLSLANHASTTASYLVVAPGYPDNSSLVWAIKGISANPMPPVGYPVLTKNQIDGIVTWIKEGAKNN